MSAHDQYRAHIAVCESLTTTSRPCETCWSLDRAADAEAFARQRQQRRSKRAAA
jgi:hypothetical protein